MAPASSNTALTSEGATVYAVECAGNLHTSVIELLVRSGAGGVLVLACPPRDCWSREGPRWLSERMYHDREAELKERVDRARVRIAYASARERAVAVAAVRTFARESVDSRPACASIRARRHHDVRARRGGGAAMTPIDRGVGTRRGRRGQRGNRLGIERPPDAARGRPAPCFVCPGGPEPSGSKTAGHRARKPSRNCRLTCARR